jgi:hypothetical protein
MKKPNPSYYSSPDVLKAKKYHELVTNPLKNNNLNNMEKQNTEHPIIYEQKNLQVRYLL